ncbi:MAG: hypothetical protein ACO3A2_06935 [Bdellovibrionia bacterium]
MTLTSCSPILDSKVNFVLIQNLGLGRFGYSGEALNPAPELRVYQIFPSLMLYTDLNESVSLQAFSDSSCHTPLSSDRFTGTSSVSLSGGIAQFSDFIVTLPQPQESTIYFSGTLGSQSMHTCSQSFSILQHFNLGKGFVHFGSPGVAGANSLSTVNDVGRIHRVTSEGNFILAGTSKNLNGGTEMALWRYLPTGALDPSFNSTGYQHSGPVGAAGATSSQEDELVVDLQITSLGDYLVLGKSKNTSGGYEIALWKIKPDGSFDSSFASSGVFHSGTPGVTGNALAGSVLDYPRSMALDRDGKIIVTGSSLNPNGGRELFVLRLNPNGSIDSSFGNSGIYRFGSPGLAGATGSFEHDIGYSVQITAQGAYIIAGTSRNPSNQYQLAVWKLLASGLTLDSTFGSQGTLTYGSTGAALGSGSQLKDIGRSLQIDPEGNLIIAGSSNNPIGLPEMALWKYSSQGALDTQFGNSGVLHSGSTRSAAGLGSSYWDEGYSVVVDAAQKHYLVSGSSKNADSGTQAALWRVSFDGSWDPTFNFYGSAFTPETGSDEQMTSATVLDQAYSISLDPVQTYTLVGSSKNSSGGTELAIWRFLNLGILNR